MVKTRNKSKLNSDECKQAALMFLQKKAKYEQITAQFNELKQQFYDSMEDYFQTNNIAGKVSFRNDDVNITGKTVAITRIQSTSIKFNADKLERRLKKEIAQQVIHKSYEIVDMGALITYLKEYGVDPKVFKSFISVSKKVDAKELDNLEELGVISAEQIKGCYTINVNSPYFKVAVEKGQSDDK